MRQHLNAGVTAGLVFLLFLVLMRSVPRFMKPLDRLPAPDVSKISTRDEFFAFCGKEESDPGRFAACREKLPVLSTSFLWVDSRYLVTDGRDITPEDLDVFYGLSGKGAESARLTISSALLVRCRRGASTEPATFQHLIDRNCLRRLPTLAELGLEKDPEWAGVQMVDSSYDGRMKRIPPQ